MKKGFSKILAVLLCIVMIAGIVPFSLGQKASAISANDSSVFLHQPKDGDSTCVFTSCLNMFRRRAIIDGDDGWQSITHSNYSSTITTNGVSVRWTITNVRGMNASMTSSLTSNKKSFFISMLNNHPEGIVIYCGGSPMHTVLLTDYDSSTDTFYCAETLSAFGYGRIPLTSCYISTANGGLSQAGVISKISQIWYITNRSGGSIEPPTPPTYATIATNKSAYALNESIVFSVSSDHATHYTIGINKYYSDTGSYSRIYTGTVAMPFSYSIDSSGTYEAYVTAYNSIGSIDSNHVYFSVGLSPTDVVLSVNKPGFAVDETICFTATAENANGYTIGINKLNESSNSYSRIYTHDIPSNFEYRISSEGIYSAYVSAWSEAGLTDSNTVYFAVGKKPVDPSIVTNKASYRPNETIHFMSTAKWAAGYTIGIDKQNNNSSGFSRLLTKDISTSFDYSVQENGVYRAYVTAWNEVGIIDSSKIMFSVGIEPSNVVLETVKTTYSAGDTIHFSASGKWVNGYTIGIAKYNATNETYNRIFTSDIGSSFDYVIDTPGAYQAYVTGWNDFGTVDSKKIYFYVGSCNILFDANGGSCGITSKTVDCGMEIGELPVAARDGYSFEGWYNKNIRITNTTIAMGNTTLTAHWKANTYSVKFNGNGATSGSMSNQAFTYDAAQNLTANAFQRKYTVTYNYNYSGSTNTTATATATFNGWATSADGAKVYNDKQSVKNLATSGTVNLYANWTLGTVTLPTPTRTGYTFAGWNTKADGTGTNYAAGASYKPTAPTTLYARWTANPPVVNPTAGSGAVVNESTRLIYGLSAGVTQSCVAVTDGTAAYEYPTARQVMGTGTKVNVFNNDNQLVDSYTVVVFGDIDGDGWYDGTDAYFVGLVANGLISQSALTAAQLAACDANHDGVIDAADVALIEKAGLLLNNIDQTAAPEELQTDSTYLEYCSLIDQSVTITEPDQPATEQPQSTAQNILAWFRTIFTVVLNWITGIFNLQIA